MLVIAIMCTLRFDLLSFIPEELSSMSVQYYVADIWFKDRNQASRSLNIGPNVFEKSNVCRNTFVLFMLMIMLAMSSLHFYPYVLMKTFDGIPLFANFAPSTP